MKREANITILGYLSTPPKPLIHTQASSRLWRVMEVLWVGLLLPAQALCTCVNPGLDFKQKLVTLLYTGTYAFSFFVLLAAWWKFIRARDCDGSIPDSILVHPGYMADLLITMVILHAIDFKCLQPVVTHCIGKDNLISTAACSVWLTHSVVSLVAVVLLPGH